MIFILLYPPAKSSAVPCWCNLINDLWFWWQFASHVELNNETPKQSFGVSLFTSTSETRAIGVLIYMHFSFEKK